MTLCEVDISLVVIQSQVSRKGNHLKTPDGALELFGLGPNPLLLLDDTVHDLMALGSHRFRGGPEEGYHTVS